MKKKSPPIPSSIARFLQEYRLENVTIESHANVLIERTLEMGNWDDLRWLFQTYGVSRIADYLRTFGHRGLSPKTFNYWRKLVGVKEYRQAPFSEIRRDVWRD